MSRIDVVRKAMMDALKAGDKPRKEALSLLLRYAFDTLGLRRVELTVFAENSRARLCYLKAGFIEEGVARQKTWKNGKFHDVVSMAVLRDEWAKREEQA